MTDLHWLELLTKEQNSRREFLNGALGLGVGASSLMALSGAMPGAAFAQSGGAGSTLLIAAPSTPSGADLDFHISPGTPDIMGNTLDQLIGYKTVVNSDGLLDLDLNTIEGRLAESWEISPDGRTVTFHLRKGVLSA